MDSKYFIHSLENLKIFEQMLFFPVFATDMKLLFIIEIIQNFSNPPLEPKKKFFFKQFDTFELPDIFDFKDLGDKNLKDSNNEQKVQRNFSFQKQRFDRTSDQNSLKALSDSKAQENLFQKDSKSADLNENKIINHPVGVWHNSLLIKNLKQILLSIKYANEILNKKDIFAKNNLIFENLPIHKILIKNLLHIYDLKAILLDIEISNKKTFQFIMKELQNTFIKKQLLEISPFAMVGFHEKSRKPVVRKRKKKKKNYFNKEELLYHLDEYES